LQALVTASSLDSVNELVKLVSLKVCSETGEIPVATVTLSVSGKEKSAEASGGGPVDASFQAIEAIVSSQCELLLYAVSNITTGTDSQGEVTVRLKKEDHIVNGLGADTDIVIASAKSYINALNKVASTINRQRPQL
jgi:2-isopropylmalate synthase